MSKRFKSKELVLQIKGADWSFKLISDASYKRRMGSDSDAATLTKSREVLFHPTGLSMNTIKHEIFHCLVDSSDVYSMSMSLDNLEELCATLVATYNLQIELWANQLMDYFLSN